MKRSVTILLISGVCVLCVLSSVAGSQVTVLQPAGIQNDSYQDTLTWRRLSEPTVNFWNEPSGVGDSIAVWFNPAGPCSLLAVRVHPFDFEGNCLVDVWDGSHYDGHITTTDSTDTNGWIGKAVDGEWIPGSVMGHSPIGWDMLDADRHHWGPFPFVITESLTGKWFEIPAQYGLQGEVDLGNNPFFIAATVYQTAGHGWAAEDVGTVPYTSFYYYAEHSHGYPGPDGHFGWFIHSPSVWFEAIVKYYGPVGGVNIALLEYDVDDDALGRSRGNGDGQIDPGETIELSVRLANFGQNPAVDVTGVLSSEDVCVEINDGFENFGDLASGETAFSVDDYVVSVFPECPAGHTINFYFVIIADPEYTSTETITLHVKSVFEDVTAFAGVGDSVGGGGVIFADFNNDDYLDLYMGSWNYNKSRNILHFNNQDGTFRDVTDMAGVGDDGWATGPVAGDYDNDGDTDIYQPNRQGYPNILFRNEGDGTFTDVASFAGVRNTGDDIDAVFGDFDNDGYLDVFVPVFGLNVLYRNDGDGTFTNVTSQAKVEHDGESRSALFTDYDDDGDLDLYVLNRYSDNILYGNNGDGTFKDVTQRAGVGGTGNAFGIASGDLDNDGDYDLYVSNHFQPNILYRNNGDGTFTNIAAMAGVDDSNQGRGVAFGDYDNDGYLDIYLANSAGPNILYHNNGNGTFSDVTASAGVSYFKGGTSFAWGDYDRDGDLDLFLKDGSGLGNHLFRNKGNLNHWLVVKTVGTISNRDGYGAQITLHAGSLFQVREVSGKGGWGCQNSLEVAFGLGHYTQADSVIIRWPSGAVQVLTDVPADQYLEVTEETDFIFTNVASLAGVGYRGKGYGVAWGDYDGDGYLDMYITNDGPNILYRNNGHGTFTDVAIQAGVDQPAEGTGAAFFDYDNDGDLDIYVENYYSADILYRNDGDGTFTDVTHDAGLGHTGWNGGTAIGDYNNDGYLDIYISVHTGANVLYKNNGDGTFTDVTPRAGVGDTGYGTGVAFADYDNDGDADLYVGNQGYPDILYRNNGDGTFSDVTSMAMLGHPGHSSCPEFGDFDNDGDLDLYLCNYGYNYTDPNILYRNNGDGTFTDVTENAGVGDINKGADARFGDCDNDGDLDIYLANRGQANVLYQNNGDGTFTDVARETGVDDQGYGLGTGWGDYDNDGDLDIYVVNSDRTNILYQNNTSGNHWLVVRTVGTISNRDGIGARVALVAGDLRQTREVGGRSGNYGQNSIPVEFGLGQHTQVDSIVIRWPSGIVQVLTDVPADQYLTIVESAHLPGGGWSVPLTIAGDSKEFLRTFGVHGGGTVGYDATYDSICPPPGFEYYASFWIDAFPHWLCRDTKEWPPSDATQPILRWLLKVVNAEGTTTTIMWEADSLPCDEGDFTLDGVDMCSESSYSFSENRDIVIEFRRCVAVTFDFDAVGGEWYLVSLPVDPVECMGTRDVRTLFPSAIDAYGWEPGFGYYQVSHMEPRRGYWLAIASACTTAIRGYPTYCYAEHFGEGWHLIGSVMEEVDFCDPCDSPHGSVLAGFGWDPVSDYYEAQTLMPTEGYWIAVGQECIVAVGCCPSFGSVQGIEETDMDAFRDKFGSHPPRPPFEIESSADRTPEKYVLHQNYPNPFNPVTTIGYTLPEAARVKVEIYNTLGQVVDVLFDGELAAGFHAVRWDGSGASSGIYFYRIETGPFSACRCMVLLK
ncbi:MAG: VCBS repeat-containing protein [Gemmatimonadota bacterium]|nr:MAG: VCBS repeat-containing protein [Gemmatimonadota bacterium]